MLPVVEVKEVTQDQLTLEELVALFIKGPIGLIDKDLFEVEEITLVA